MQQDLTLLKAAEINAVKAQYAKGGQKAVTDPEFPAAGVMIPALAPYAGQQLLTGAGAQVYANDFIAKHLYAMPLHGVYSNVSTAARSAKPGSATATAMAGLDDRRLQEPPCAGLLLEAYGLSMIDVVLLWGAIAALHRRAALLAVLVDLGVWQCITLRQKRRRSSPRHRVAAAA